MTFSFWIFYDRHKNCIFRKIIFEIFFKLPPNFLFAAFAKNFKRLRIWHTWKLKRNLCRKKVKLLLPVCGRSSKGNPFKQDLPWRCGHQGLWFKSRDDVLMAADSSLNTFNQLYAYFSLFCHIISLWCKNCCNLTINA